MPMLRALGYDVFDLNPVVPEFIADVGVKNGEKVDYPLKYALKFNDDIAVLIETTAIGADLSEAPFNQLYRYFNVTNARIGILTPGPQCAFFPKPSGESLHCSADILLSSLAHGNLLTIQFFHHLIENRLPLKPIVSHLIN